VFAPGAPIETYLDVAVSVSWRVLVVGVIGIAILRYDLYDIGAALRRSAVYVALTIGLVSIFLLVYIAVLAFVTRVSAGASAPWIAAVAATAVVLCAEPARRRINSRLDRKLFGDRGRPLEVLKRLDENVRSGDESAVLHTVAETVAHAVHSPAVAVGVQRESNVDVVVGKDEVDPESVVIPALHRGERVGELRVAPRSRRAAFSRADLVLLSHLGDQLGNLLYGFRQDREVAAQRQRVMTAARDERNRMASDLHDGLAPLLAGAGLAADGLRRGLPADSSDAADAARLAERLRQAATQVREIAYGLRSNPLADQGLAVMVIDHLNTLMSGQVPRFDCHADIPRLPAIVEQEVYLVLLEATNNVVRHARAQHCTVDLTVHDAMLQVVVEDDGIGLSRPYVSGMGLTSMRSRVTALGGALDLTSASVQGTRMVARIPVTMIDTD
jgi:signal transduction histidine kinase